MTAASDHTRRRVPPAALWAAAAAAQRLLTDDRGTSTSRLASLAAAAPSTWMLGGAVGEFRRRNTTVNPIAVDHVSTLVESGPNEISRNPMYVGMAGLLAAHAVARRSPSSLAPAVLFVLAIDRFQIPPEEEALKARFGQAYETYAARVPRWLGRPR